MNILGLGFGTWESGFPGLLALGTPAQGTGASPWVQFIPFIFVLAIFYFIVLLPMKKRQTKVQQFLSGLKVNDRVITSGGIYGTITKVGGSSLQLQIANNVRIEVSRSAIVGYQGQEPVGDSLSQSKSG
jgi:preprotein translocase subunit YajC